MDHNIPRFGGFPVYVEAFSTRGHLNILRTASFAWRNLALILRTRTSVVHVTCIPLLLSKLSKRAVRPPLLHTGPFLPLLISGEDDVAYHGTKRRTRVCVRGVDEGERGAFWCSLFFRTGRRVCRSCLIDLTPTERVLGSLDYVLVGLSSRSCVRPRSKRPS